MTLGMHFVLKLYKEKVNLYWILSTTWKQLKKKRNSLEI